MTLYTQWAYDDLCGFSYPQPVYKMESGVLFELRPDAFGRMRKSRLITTDLSSYLKFTL
ncbi:MAG: hypothetical protein Q8878_07355 [Bacillota bacterium]|nr:hypothetical protein [Bacillota bacterium]